MDRRAFLHLGRTLIVQAIIVAAVLLALVPTSFVAADSVVTFPDPNLEAAIREAIEKPTGDIHESDFGDLEWFTASDRGIVDLTGLERCPMLDWLDVSHNRIGDLSFFSKLSLVHLDLSYNQIDDTSPLAGIGFDALLLGHNQIRNCSGLHTMEILDLSYNQMSDLSSCSDFRTSSLYLDHNQITDIRPLVEDASIVIGTSLDLRGNPLNSISIDTYIPALQARNVDVAWDARPVTFADPNLEAAIREAIEKPTGPIYETDVEWISHVDAAGLGIVDLTGLEHCTISLWLDLSNNQISDLSALSGKEMDNLLLNGNRIRDIEPLVSGGWGPVSSIDLRDNPLSSTSINTYIPALQSTGAHVVWDAAGNQYPERPVNTSPADGTIGISLIPTLEGSAFSDPDGDTHAASRWQVRSSSGDFDSPVWDSGSTSPTTSTTVPSGKLNDSATYYWRVGYRDSRNLWSSYSKETSFTTVATADIAPTVATVAASSIGSTSATLNLSLTSLGSASSVQVSFEWGTGTAYGGTTTPQTMTGDGSFGHPLSGLSPATTYYFRALAQGDGVSYGNDMSFTTSAAPVAPPAVTTNPATGVGMDIATLNGDLTAVGSAASVQGCFEWGLTVSYGSATPARAMAGVGNFSADPSGLAANTTYHFRAKAVGDDTAYGSDMTFTTSATPTTPPAVTTGDADGVTGSSARLNGNLTSTGTAASVTVSFVWGTTSGGPYPNETTGVALTGLGAFNFDLSGLAAGTTLYYQARVVGNGTNYGAEKSFTTTGTAPVIANLTADSGRQGDVLTVTITGANLSSATLVVFGDGISVAEFRVVSESEITADIAIESSAATGKRDVTIITSQGMTTAPESFQVNGASTRVHLWVYLVAVAGGLVALGILASLGVWLRQRLAKSHATR